MIQEIPEEVAKTVKSQQYIFNLYIIVKELVENSLDAHSSKIKIQLGDRIIVEDDGEGIEDLLTVCKPGYTSKEATSYGILQIPGEDQRFSHGFRGQALSAIKELCDVEISTRVRAKNDECDMSDGLGLYRDFKSETTEQYPREYGTTVKVTNLFKSCAVRRRLNEKSLKKQYAQIVSMTQAFCYVYDVSFTILEKKKLLYASQGSSNTREYSIKKHGEVYLEIEEEYFSLLLFPLCKDKIQVLMLEKRIIVCNKLTNMVNTLFKRYFDYIPTFVLTLRDVADVNMSVDKSEVVIKNMKFVESRIRSEMDLYFSQRLFIHGTQARGYNNRLNLVDANQQDSCQDKLLNNQDQCCTFPSKKDTTLFGLIDGIKDTSDSPIKLKAPCSVVAETSGPDEATKQVIFDEFPSDALKAISHPAGQTTPENPFKIEVIPSNMSAYSIIKEKPLFHPNIQIEKSDFINMTIIGQFNHGFILCTLEKDGTTFLLTVDQHAADEIYNFEMLQNSFCLKKQKLVTPILLELTPIQMLFVEGNFDVFAKNGFIVEDNKLLTIPVYKGYFFTVKDFMSLLENIPLEIYESDKFREIMASKACRSSIMIGMALSVQEMRDVLHNLSTLRRPWNCPHGRPTFKILTEL